MKYRKIPIEIEAKQWDGTPEGYEEICTWTNTGFARIQDGRYTAKVYDVLHDTWVKLATGDFIIQGVSGEFYPCEADVFERTYLAA